MDAFLSLFTFDGRANRAWYLWHIILDDLAIFTMVVVLLVTGVMVGTPLVALPLMGVVLAGVWAGIAITVKRLHDLGRSGWHWFLLAVPLYNVYLGLVLLFGRGTPGPNRFGPDPLGVPYASQHLLD